MKKVFLQQGPGIQFDWFGIQIQIGNNISPCCLELNRFKLQTRH